MQRGKSSTAARKRKKVSGQMTKCFQLNVSDLIQRVEDELSKNSEYRLRLMQLQQAWDLMDDLPRVSSDESFTKSTVELIVVSAESEANATVVRRKTWRNVIWVIG